MSRYECPNCGIVYQTTNGDGTPPHRVCADCGATVARCWGRP